MEHLWENYFKKRAFVVQIDGKEDLSKSIVFVVQKHFRHNVQHIGDRIPAARNAIYDLESCTLDAAACGGNTGWSVINTP